MKNYTFIDLTKPGQRAIWATWAFGVAQVAFSLVHIYQNMVINDFIDQTAGQQELVQSDNLTFLASIGLLVVLVGAYAINARFLFLASRNASAIAPDPKAISPGWAVGWYVVPIANLWMPFTAMKQTWSRLFPNTGNIPQWFGLWWFSWIGMNIFDRILGRMPAPNNLPDYLDYNNLLIISGFLWLIPTYMFVTIVRALKDARPDLSEVFE